MDGVADAQRDGAPKIAEPMDAARDDALAYPAFPTEHWLRVSSTNRLERLDGEIKPAPTWLGSLATIGRSFASSARRCQNTTANSRSDAAP
jgi:transposase-like protein